MGTIKSYEDLVAWQKAYALVLEVYRVTKLLPDDERFGLVSQMRRAAVSIPSNIAEGWGRRSRTDYIRFLKMAIGSCYELHTQLRLATDLGYMRNSKVIQGLNEVERIVNALIRSLEKTSDNNP